MQRPGRWLIGLPILAGLVFYAAQALTPRIEAEIGPRVAARLGVDPVAVAVSGRDVAISGLDPAARAGAAKALQIEPGVRKFVFVETGVAAPPSPAPASPAPVASAPPPRDPYVFVATLGESLVALDGKLPSAEARKNAVVLAAAAGAGLAVSDGARIDPNAPAGDYAAALGVALVALRSLEQGRIALSDNRLSIEGRGRENVTADRLSAEIKSRLPPGYELVKADIAAGPASPYLFEATRKGGLTTLGGFAPDDATRARLVDAARRRFFDSIVEDRLSIAQGAPPKFAEAVGVALAALARLEDGKLSLVDTELSLSGAARFDLARSEIAADVENALPKNFKGDVRLVSRARGAPLDAVGCRAAFAELSKSAVKFAADDSAVSDESTALVDGLTAAVLRCQTVPVEVAGHTDNVGDAAANRDRSKRRARLLVDKFVKAGADAFHVWAMGYGGDKPVAPNDSEDGRARNRRIEFIVH